MVHAGDAFAIASSLGFAASNVLVAQGMRGAREDNGAFLSLIITTVLAGGLWVALGLARGFEPLTWRGLAWFCGAGLFSGYIGRVFSYASIEKLGAMRGATMKRLIPFFSVMLGVGVLGESLTPGMVAGMALIVASFAMLVLGERRRAPAGGGPRPGINIGYLYGPVAAAGYAVGALLRKLGLAEAHDALLGAALGCLVGIVLFLATAAFSAPYAKAVRATFRRPSGWLLGAGTAATLGQVSYFAALDRAPMARVALISSSEVFVTLLLGWIFLRRRETLTLPVLVAAILGFAGAALVIGL